MELKRVHGSQVEFDNQVWRGGAKVDSIASAMSRIQTFVDGCIECGSCQAGCTLQGSLSTTLRNLFHQLLDGKPSGEAQWFVTRCSLCGLCSSQCCLGLNVPRTVTAARQVFLERGATNQKDYQAMFVDRDVHTFMLYRDTYNISFDDLKREQSDVMFFPGCTLCSYAPELTRAAHRWLEEQEGPVAFSEQCCGFPLAEIGLQDRATRFVERLYAQVKSMHARRVVTACPNCYYHLKEELAGLEIVSLFDLMDQRHVRIESKQLVTVHDSCPDRSGAIGTTIRHLVQGSRLVEMPHRGATTLCCGSGGIVSMIDPDLCTERAQTRLAEFDRTDADCCITACMACAYRLARGRPRARVAHILELVFGMKVDYGEIQARAQAMWQGEWGAYNRARLKAA